MLSAKCNRINAFTIGFIMTSKFLFDSMRLFVRSWPLKFSVHYYAYKNNILFNAVHALRCC